MTTLSVSGTVGSGVTVKAAASAKVTTLSPTPFSVTLTQQDGALVVWATGLSLAPLGVTFTGAFVYSSAKVAKFALPGYGTVSLVKGFNAFAHYTPSSSFISVCKSIGFDLSTGDVITISVGWTPTKSKPKVTFSATLGSPAGGIPFLTIPGGGQITTASATLSSTETDFALVGTIPTSGATTAVLTMDLTVDRSGAFTGTVKVTTYVLFGQVVTLTGTLSRDGGGKLSADIKATIPGPFTPFSGLPVTFSAVSLSLGTGGLTFKGTATITGLGSLTVAATFTSFRTWSMSVTGKSASSWSPVPTSPSPRT